MNGGVTLPIDETFPVSWSWDRSPPADSLELGPNSKDTCLYFVFCVAVEWPGGVLNDSVFVGLSSGHGRDIHSPCLLLRTVVISTGWNDPLACVDCGEACSYEQPLTFGLSWGSRDCCVVNNGVRACPSSVGVPAVIKFIPGSSCFTFKELVRQHDHCATSLCLTARRPSGLVGNLQTC